MSNQTTFIPPIPPETARLAKSVFGAGNFYIRVGERGEAILERVQFEGTSETGSLNKTSLGLLAMVTFFQFIEGLTDHQALDALRTRIDWKYALHLPLHTPAFQQMALCLLRQRILGDPASQREFQKLFDQLIQLSPPTLKRPEEFESLHLVSTICLMNRLEWAQEGMIRAIQALAISDSAWLRLFALPHWYGRYKHPIPSFDPYASMQQQESLLHETGKDIQYLLEQIHQSGSPEIHELPEIRALERLWGQRMWKWDHPPDNHLSSLEWINCDSCILRSK
jgi:hypothetical protein